MLVGLPFVKDPEAAIKKIVKQPNSQVWSFFHFVKEKFQVIFD